jgi:hypothetical protein
MSFEGFSDLSMPEVIRNPLLHKFIIEVVEVLVANTVERTRIHFFTLNHLHNGKFTKQKKAL